MFSRKQIIEAVFLSVLDYGDATYRHVCASTLKTLDSVDHSAQRLITSDGYSGNSFANRWRESEVCHEGCAQSLCYTNGEAPVL